MVPEGKADFNCISYAKMIFHALKYPHCAVFGLLVGSSERVICIDAVPVLHEPASLNVVPEIALALVDSQCAYNSWNIVGVYFCNELLDDKNLDPSAVRIADKIALIFPQALIVQIVNTALRADSSEASIIVYNSQNKVWRPKKFQLENEEAVSSLVLSAIQNKLFREITDFENHLDNPSNDHWNCALNEKIEHHCSPLVN
ncbi:unnamed protein product [Dracunculus medinensis]|uniref:MPN domain-containing protein n=1 Tax=Dracunculus medinensis TaxID=318479 RepID=A0A0N4UB32_DRAME|nr:unnamed protein product [Dracunculus medinensis]